MRKLTFFIGLILLFFAANATTIIKGDVYFNDGGINMGVSYDTILVHFSTVSGFQDYVLITDEYGAYQAELTGITSANIIVTYKHNDETIIKNITIVLDTINELDDVIFYDMTNGILFTGVVSSDTGSVNGAEVFIESNGGEGFSGNEITDENGYYELFITGGQTKMQFTATAVFGGASQEKNVSANVGDTVVLNFFLRDSIQPQGDAYVDFAWNNDLNNYLTVYFFAFLDTIDMKGFGQVNYIWDFGDGIQQEVTSDSIVHIYPAEGDYPVTLSVTTLGSGDTIATFNDSIFVYSYFPGDIECFADFYYYPLDDQFMEYQFENYSYGTDDATAYFWDFGDGGTSAEELPVHLYQTSGEYLVTLVMDNGDCADTMSQLIWVGVDEVWFPDSCQALFYTYYLDSMLVEFDDIAYADGQIIERYWDFGDGTDAYTVAYPMHVYADTGVYTVSYSIVTDGGCMSTYTQDIFVYDTPDTSLLFFPTAGGGKAASVKVHGLGDDDDDWIWNFGDSKSAKGVVEHTYENPGNYTITAINRYTGSSYGMDIRINDDWSMEIIKGYAYSGGSGTGVKEMNMPTVNIYPNPVSDKLNIVLDNAQNASVTILDASGRVVFENDYNAQNITINVNDLRPGMYIVTIRTTEGLSTAKFVK